MKKYKYVAIFVVILLTIFCMVFVYGYEYRYANTESGRLAAVKEYVLSEDSSLEHHLQIGTPIDILGWHEAEGTLFVFFQADTDDNVRGVLSLAKGINGRYRPVEQNMHPSQFVYGIDKMTLRPEGSDKDLYAMIGRTDGNISYAELTYSIKDLTGIIQPEITKRYNLTEDFINIYEAQDLIEEVGFVYYNNFAALLFSIDEMRLYDNDGNDITAEYQDSSVDLSWVGSKSSGSIELSNLVLYVVMGMLALGGIIIARLIWKDANN